MINLLKIKKQRKLSFPDLARLTGYSRTKIQDHAYGKRKMKVWDENHYRKVLLI